MTAEAKRFAGKVALITGSGRGIGRAIALRLAADGADIIVNYFRDRASAEATAAEIEGIGSRAHVVKANVGDIDDVRTLVHAASEHFGRLDFLIHNAASGYNRPAVEQKPRGWDWTMNINARSLLFAAQFALPLLRARGGAIVALSSMGAGRVLPDYVVVGASKAALETVVRYLGVEFAPYDVTVNAVSPGVVETDALRHFEVFRRDEDNLVESIRSRTPRGRLCTPEDVAEIVAFLCSPGARMICGQTIVIDGGYSLLA